VYGESGEIACEAKGADGTGWFLFCAKIQPYLAAFQDRNEKMGADVTNRASRDCDIDRRHGTVEPIMEAIVMQQDVEAASVGKGYPLSIGTVLCQGVEHCPGQEIVYADQTRLSYRDLNARVARLACGLSRLGIRAGDTVAVMDWDSHRYLECFFAIPMMGARLHMINVRLSAEQILYTINHAEDDLILVNGEFLPLLEQIWDRIEGRRALVLLNDGMAEPKTHLPVAQKYESLLAGADPEFDFPEFPEDTPATTFYTTGTTGLPKGVAFTHRQILLHTLSAAAALARGGHGRFDETDVYMPITPMFHVHAWGIPYVATAMGVKQVYPGRYVPERLLELLVGECVTFSHCVPTILQMLLAAAQAKGTRLPGWKVVVGGAALPQALARHALDMGIDVYAGYGMSETCPILTLSRLQPEMKDWALERQIEFRCKTGRPIPLVRVRVVDTDMRDVPADGKSQGEIVVRAPWATTGYVKDPAGSAQLWEGGWLHTGDIAVSDEYGYLKITDRLKDVIKSGGEWVSSIDLEDLILQHTGVAEAAVIGVPDPKWTERPLAVVVAKPGEQVHPDEIEACLLDLAASGVISRYAVPQQIVPVDTLPRTSVGKVDKKVLRARYAAAQ
jgi:fatty-acyl-CoA synthase